MPDPITPAGLPSPATQAADTLDLQRATEQATSSQRALNIEFEISKQQGRQFGQALTSAFVGIAIQGKSLGDVLRGLAQSLSKLALNAAFKPLESALGSAQQGLVSGGFAQGAGATLPAGTPGLFASGGAISAPAEFPLGNGAMFSKQQGDGAFAASGSGVANRNSGLASAGRQVAVTFNVTTPDAESFRRSETQLAAMLARSVGSGQRNL